MRHCSAIFFIIAFSAAVSAVPDEGMTGIDNSYLNDYSGSTSFNTQVNEWIVCRADSDSAWIASYDSGMDIQKGDPLLPTNKPGGRYDAIKICQELGYASADAFGGTCGTVCGYCEEHFGGTEQYDGGGGSLSDLGSTVHWKCVDFLGSGDDIPEFTSLGAMAALLGAGLYAYKRRK